MREEMSDVDEAAPYNEFLKELKGRLLEEELGGNRKEMWFYVRRGRLGLLQAKECSGGVSEEEAQAFFSAK